MRRTSISHIIKKKNPDVRDFIKPDLLTVQVRSPDLPLTSPVISHVSRHQLGNRRLRLSGGAAASDISVTMETEPDGTAPVTTARRVPDRGAPAVRAHRGAASPAVSNSLPEETGGGGRGEMRGRVEAEEASKHQLFVF